MKILVVDPIVKSDMSEHIHKTYVQIKTSDVKLGFETLREGPSFIETEEHEHAAIPDLLRVIKEAEQQGYEAVIINCFGNPGLEEAESLVNIPVIGAGKASFDKVKGMGKRFTVLTTVEPAVRRVKRNARRYEAEELLVSVRPLGLHVPELRRQELQRSALLTQGRKAISEDHAEVIVLGCTGMAENAKWLSDRLGVPVIDPTQAALEAAVKLLKSEP